MGLVLLGASKSLQSCTYQVLVWFSSAYVVILWKFSPRYGESDRDAEEESQAQHASRRNNTERTEFSLRAKNEEDKINGARATPDAVNYNALRGTACLQGGNSNG